MKVIVIEQAYWEKVNKKWVRRSHVCKIFYDRDRPFAELWVKLHMKDYNWTKKYNPQPFYTMYDAEINYV
jgi:hypothetical protein